MQVVDIQPSASGPKELAYDAEWLAILRETHHLLSPGSFTRLPPSWTGAQPHSGQAELARQPDCTAVLLAWVPCSSMSMLQAAARCTTVALASAAAAFLTGVRTQSSSVLQSIAVCQCCCRLTHTAWSAGQAAPQPPPAEEHTASAEAALQQQGAAVHLNFVQTAPSHNPSQVGFTDPYCTWECASLMLIPEPFSRTL